MKRITPFLFLLIIGTVFNAFSQAVNPVITPDFFAPDDEITIEYDVTGSDLSALTEAYLWTWLPQLSDFNPSSNINPANSNSGATSVAKFEKIEEAGKTSFRLRMVPTTFFGKPSNDIRQLGLILKGNDWGDGQTSDFFIDIVGGFSLKFDPAKEPFSFYKSGDSIEINAKTSAIANVTITIDGMQVESLDAITEIAYKHAVINDDALHKIEVKGIAGSDTALIYHSYRIEPITPEVALPNNLDDGINYQADVTKSTLVLTAPNKKNVFVIGEFNDWSIDPVYLMNKDGDKFWIEINNLTPGKEYLFQYLVDGELRIADPYARKISSPFDDAGVIAANVYPGLKPFPSEKTKNAAAYLQTAQVTYNWEVEDFNKPDKEDLIIYEMLIRDFTDKRTYLGAIERFDYLKDLGINAIELMPVMEFEGNDSWGYNPAFMTAADKYYGTQSDLKKFIDEAHKRGIAVILDIALNHSFGRNPLVRLYNGGGFSAPTADNPWLNTEAKHDFNVGYDFNHESQYTKDYVDRVVTYWIDEFGIDGYRFDLSKGFTQKLTKGNISAWNKLDQSRVDLLKRIRDVVWTADPTAYIILEHLADNEEEKVLANEGMMLWGKATDKFDNLSVGNITGIGSTYFKFRGFDEPHLVSYMESHDEERLMWTLGKRKSTYSLQKKLDLMKLNAAFFLTVPGPKMIWQFGEMGYDEELNDSRLAIKPTHWEYLEDADRAKLKDVYQALINLRTKTDYISSDNFEWESSGAVKWINGNHPEVQLSIVGNFSNRTVAADPHFQAAGVWYDYLSGEEITVTDPNAEVSLSAGEFHIYTSKVIDNYIEGDPSPIVLSTDKASILDDLIRIYPNPTESKIWFSTTLSKQKQVEIFNLQGAQVLNIATSKDALDVSGLLPGVYVMHITIGTHKQIESIVIR